MCGINLVLNYPEKGLEAIEKLMKATCHRGPDHSELQKVAAGIFVAGNRLKTVDLGEAGNQPIRTQDGKGILVWNGSLYNYEELKNQLLLKGVLFKSRSDSEVLVNWLKIYGKEGVKDLKGMFAFIFVDQENERIIIGRDPYGKKPLYFYHQQEKWVFSSEAKALASCGLIYPELDKSQFLPYFYSRHSFPDRSFYKGIYQLKAGNIWELDFAGNSVSTQILVPKSENNQTPTLGEFKAMVVDAVLSHFEAEVPVGIILSGGADSGLLLHTWYKETGIPLHTFTAAFEKKYQKKYQDPFFASTLASRYHCAHHEVMISPEVVMKNWATYISCLDQPIGDSASFLTWLIAGEAKNHVRILISGAGADELFSGYDRHMAFRQYLKHRQIFKFLSIQKKFISLISRRIKKMLDGIAGTDEKTYLNFSSLQNIPETLEGEFLSFYPKGLSPYKAALVWDREYYLINDVLKIHDNANMAHGVEGRAPFLDQALVNLSNGLTEDQHLLLKPKQWIKEILREEGLENIADRKKLGFGLPLKEWLQDDPLFREWVLSGVKAFGVEQAEHLPEDMRKLALNPDAFLNDGFLQVWNLFILASWKDKHL